METYMNTILFSMCISWSICTFAYLYCLCKLRHALQERELEFSNSDDHSVCSATCTGSELSLIHHSSTLDTLEVV
jgi:hypothetical protein